jgi:hypothetical protein
MAAHEDFGIILIESTLVVANCWHVLDDNSVIWVFTLLIKHSVGFNHVINNVGFGDLLGTELLLGAEVLAIVVTQVVVAGDGGELDTGADQEINQSRFHLSLARFEVITANEGIVLLGEFNGTRNKGVLRRAVDEGYTFKDTGNRKDRGWCNLLVAIFNSLQQVLSSVIDAVNEICETLSVCSPLNNDLFQRVLGFEVTIVSLMKALESG